MHRTCNVTRNNIQNRYIVRIIVSVTIFFDSTNYIAENIFMYQIGIISCFESNLDIISLLVRIKADREMMLNKKGLDIWSSFCEIEDPCSFAITFHVCTTKEKVQEKFILLTIIFRLSLKEYIMFPTAIKNLIGEVLASWCNKSILYCLQFITIPKINIL